MTATFTYWGAVLLRDREWDALLASTVVVAVLLGGTLASAVSQARRMARLRRRAIDSPADGSLATLVHRGARTAGILRAVLGLLTLMLLVLGCLLAS